MPGGGSQSIAVCAQDNPAALRAQPV